MSLIRRRQRQRNLRRETPRVDQPRPSPPASAPSAPSATFTLGKIVQVNRKTQDVEIAPLKTGVDPRDPAKWSDDANFDVQNAICCAWTGGFPVCDVGWPAICVETQAGRVAMYWLQLHPDTTTPNAFCQPDGTLAPALPANCPDLPDPGICTRTYACCLPSGTCQEMNERDCLVSGGEYYGPGTTLGGTDGQHCTSQAGGTVDCAPLVACLDPISGQCVDTRQGQCPPGNNEFPCTCAEFFAPPIGCP